MLLVSGANGNLGGAVIANLLELVTPEGFAVGTRNPDSPFARELRGKGVDVRLLDFDVPETLPAAFGGVAKALIISTYSENSVRLGQHLNALEAAKAAGVGHIIYTSFLGASPHSLAEHSQLVHYPTERAIMASGLRYTILRHALYAEIMVNDLDHTIATGVLHRPGGDARCAYIARSDLGASAATVLARAGHENRIYSETMPEPLTGPEIARMLSETFDTPIRYEPVAAEDWPDYMADQWHVPRALAASAMGTMRAIEAGEFDIATDDYRTITGRKPRSFRQFLQDVKSSRDQATAARSNG